PRCNSEFHREPHDPHGCPGKADRAKTCRDTNEAGSDGANVRPLAPSFPRGDAQVRPIQPIHNATKQEDSRSSAHTLGSLLYNWSLAMHRETADILQADESAKGAFALDWPSYTVV